MNDEEFEVVIRVVFGFRGKEIADEDDELVAVFVVSVFVIIIFLILV